MIEEKFIGKGMIFPIELDSTGFPVVSSGVRLINSSIKMILGWTFMHRIFLSQFGSRCYSLLEEPNDLTLRQLVEHFAYDALSKWEPRIILDTVSASRTEDTKLSLSISYRVKSSGLEHTFIYPFYREVTY